MKSDPIRTRWSDTGPDADFAESFAGSLFRSAPAPRSRKSQAILALLVEIRRRQLARHAAWFQPTAYVRRAGVVLSVFVSVNIAMALTVSPVRRWWSNTLQLEQSHAVARPAPSVAAPAAVGHPASSVVAVAPEVALEPGASPLVQSSAARPAVSPAASSVASPVASPMASIERARRNAGLRQASGGSVLALAAPSAPAPLAAVALPSPTLAVESQLLEVALKALNHGQPSQALAAIATYRQRFPNGSLSYEANLAEVKAQMAVGQNGRALSVLEKIIATAGFDSLPRSTELTLLHAELLARTKDCTRAIAAFDQLALSPDLEAPLAERALYGRAACFASQGDWPGNQSALREYLRRFPSGRFAAEAREGLSRGE